MKIRLDGLRLQLLLLLVLPFGLVLVLVALASVRVHQQAMRRLVAERDEWAARAAASAISEQLHHRQSSVRTLALRLGENLDPNALLQQEGYLLPDFDRGMAIVDRDGQVLASNPAGTDWTSRPIVASLVGTKPGEAVFSGSFDEDGVAMALAVARSETGGASIGAFTVPPLLRSALSGVGSSESGPTGFLTDDTGKLLASLGTSPGRIDLLDHPGVVPALHGEQGSTFIPGPDGEHVVSFSPIEQTKWALVIEEPWELVSSPVLNLSLLGPLALVPALLLTLVALWFGARQVIEPLRRLEAKADRLASGDFTLVDDAIGGIAEIQHLQGTLDTMARKIRASQEALRGYISSITRAQEEERRRLARELHDTTIQDLIALDQQIQILNMKSGDEAEPVRSGELSGLHRATQGTIEELRRVTRGLRPMYLEDLGLVPALEMLSKDASADLSTPMSFRVEGTPRRLPPEAELALYRIVQESLSNVARHAHANHAEVVVQFTDDTLMMDVRDDGAGFDLPEHPGDLAAAGHYGLLGMHERAEIIGAKLSIASEPGKGTTVSIRLSQFNPDA